MEIGVRERFLKSDSRGHTVKTKIIRPSDRHWAGKRYQNLLGYFELDPSGLFLSSDVSEEHRLPIVEAFSTLPPQLIELSCAYELTLNVSPFGNTFSENVCTIYADWEARDRKAVSPHVEVGRSAFGIDLKPYLAHEISHLWWRSLPSAAQESYRQFLLETTAETDLEVTGYAHRKFERYLSLNRPESGERSPGKYTAPHSLALRNAREIWMEESFCETVAMLVVPDYKSDEDWAATIDLAMRQVSIAQVTKLKL